jgi:thiamine biosynthesis lipoprotein
MSSQYIFDAIGTHWVIDIEDVLTKEKENTLFKKITDRITVFDKDYSRFRADSLVTAMSLEKGQYVLPDDAEKMMSMYKRMYDITGGLMTPLIGQALVDAGYDATYSLTQQRPLSEPRAWEMAMTYTYPYIDIHIPVLLDFGACGKGYLIDIVGGVLEENGVQSFCVDAGGDMVYKSAQKKSLVVGLEHPDMPLQTDGSGTLIGTVSILNQSLCGSAGNRRTWGDFHHIINPDTLKSPQHIRAVWVVADECMTADALTTALFFVSPEKLLSHFNFEYCIIHADYSIEKSAGFQAEIFT